MGASATDHAALTPYTRACRTTTRRRSSHAPAPARRPADLAAFTGHMLMEMARMSVEDGLVMQLHPGSLRNHNAPSFDRFGPDRGCDIPLATEYTRTCSRC
jgi:glucuronate isomerase